MQDLYGKALEEAKARLISEGLKDANKFDLLLVAGSANADRLCRALHELESALASRLDRLILNGNGKGNGREEPERRPLREKAMNTAKAGAPGAGLTSLVWFILDKLLTRAGG